MFTHIDLFSGIGGFALACRWNGIETVQFVEIDPFCQQVLNKNFLGVPIHDDIKTFKYDGDIPFILTGGFPCQPFSCAGKRRGKEDDRFLWPEMLRVVSETKPSWVVGENVAGFINMGLDDCISDMEDQGYEVQAFVIPACAVNAPHRRDRVWIVGRKCDHAADTEECGRRKGNKDYPWTLTGTSKTRERRGPSHSSSMWNEPWIEAATRLCRVDARVSNRVDRLKSLGNAIVPQVAAEIIRAIVEVENGRGEDYL